METKLKRNKEIRKKYKVGLGGIIGRAQNPPISRQRINKIVHQTQTLYQTHHNGIWGVFWGRLKEIIVGIK